MATKGVAARVIMKISSWLISEQIQQKKLMIPQSHLVWCGVSRFL